MLRRNDTVDGVKLLTLLENWFGSRSQALALWRSWLSMRATLSFEVIGDAPVVTLYQYMPWLSVLCYTYEVRPIALGPRARLQHKPHRRAQGNLI